MEVGAEKGACHCELLFTVTGTNVAAYLPIFYERHSRVPTPDAGRADPCLAGRCICQFCQSGLKARMEGFEPSDPFGSPVFGTGCLLD